MSNYKEKFIAKLKEIPEIKEDMEKLEFGCEIIISTTKCSGDEIYTDTIKAKYLQWDWDYSQLEWWHWDMMVDWELSSYSVKMFELWETPWDNTFEIIWTLKERHLRMYFKNKGLYLTNNEEWEFFNTRSLNEENFKFKLDNKKDFDQQDDSVYKEIVEFLEK